MATGEVKALSDVLGVSARALTSGIEDMHGVFSTRAWRPVGPAGKPSQAVHDVVSAGVYEGVRVGLTVGASIGGTVLDRVGDKAGWTPVSETKVGGFLVGVLNGLAGDRLAEAGSEVALPMAVRAADGSGDVALRTEALRAAHPGAGGDVVVFLHGLFESDRAWRRKAESTYGDADVTYGSRLADDIGATPVYLRYNTGLRIAENGTRLDALLAELMAAWPVPIERLSLVGHSMGGLVIRSACHRAEHDATGSSWIGHLRHAVYLGSPHHGAPLARGLMGLGGRLQSVPDVRPLANVLQGLSAGIDDLRHGAVAERVDIDPEDDDLLAGSTGTPGEQWHLDDEVTLLPTCRHHAVVATLAAGPGSLIDHTLGDMFVQTGSGNGSHPGRRSVGFPEDDGFRLHNTHHFALLNHPAIYRQLRRWLEEDVPGRAPLDANLPNLLDRQP